ncbi:LytR/AlgR family response regulator transcription factor [Sunxiuqinia rutila]|uniref:LytR/AlgR family response regulator transcription factor n=1 Tax=Sunxiuqinia rutila TaxID=1397841 RepID=UPI003D36BB85
MKAYCEIQEHDESQGASLVLKNIIVSKGLTQLILPIQEILYFFHENKNVFVVTEDNETYFCELGLSAIEKDICPGFFRINRQVIVNYNAIQSFSYIENSKIELCVRHGSGRNMIIGKNKVASFKKWIMFDCTCFSAPRRKSFKEKISGTLPEQNVLRAVK